jgi:radical SAM superfamily enzyme YgiQ (UPF0313 family)
MTEVAELIQHRLLPRVSKPNRYLGNALHAPRKPLDRAEVGVLLAFPDAYEIGLSNVGIRIIPSRVEPATGRRRRADVRALAGCRGRDAGERHSAVLARHARAASAFDVIGFSLQYELQYTNVLAMLDLAGLPLRTRDRDARHPLVIAGGAQAFSPEPMAEFIDCFVVGDAEEAIHTVVDLVGAAKRERWSRPALLRRLAHVRGCYVPSGYDLDSTPEGRLAPHARPGFPARVNSAWVQALKSEYYPAAPLLPVGEITHDRLSVEIMRGCTRGCRFCQAGMINRPVREKPAQQIVEEVLRGLDATGLEEVSLISLSSTDHTQIVDQVNALADELCPDARADLAAVDAARQRARRGRAPHGGAAQGLDHARAGGRHAAHA